MSDSLIRTACHDISTRDFFICAEQNADDTVVRWMLTEPLFEGIDGTPHNYRLKYTREELRDEVALRAFSFYLNLSWAFREDERVWRQSTLDEYFNNPRQRHPLYQFRLYNAFVNRTAAILLGMIDLNNGHNFITAEGKTVDEALVHEIYSLIFDYILSLESCFDISYEEDERDWLHAIQDSMRSSHMKLPLDPLKLPYAPPFFDDAAKAEVERIRGLWPRVKRTLEASGTYAKLYESI